MVKNLLPVCLIILICWPQLRLTTSAHQDDKRIRPRARAESALAQLPVCFEENRGQFDADVKYLARANGYQLRLGARESLLAFNNGRHLKLQLVGGNGNAEMSGEDRLIAKSNYFLGNDAREWHTDINNYGSVRYHNVYDGIDMRYYSQGRALEYDFIVAPGVDAQAIKMRFEGARKLSIDNHGDLLIDMGGEQLRQSRPVVYQEVNGIRKTIGARFVIKNGLVGFVVGAYDRSLPLVIDPVLVYSTYYGGSAFELGGGIATDAAGNVYVTGRTFSANFPVRGAVQSTPGGGSDAYVIKLDSAGRLVYATFLGGAGEDNGNVLGSIVVDSSNSVYLTGDTTSRNFPVTANAFQSNFGGPVNDGFVAKLNADGNGLIFSTYLGGNNGDAGTALTLDAAGNLYVGGSTISGNFPIINSPQPRIRGDQDLFVVKFTPTFSVAYSLITGGSGFDPAIGVAVDSAGNAYAIGVTNSTNLPTVNALQSNYGGGVTDAFLVKINAAGSSILFATYLGGGGQDFGAIILLDQSGNINVCGEAGNGFPTTANALQRAFGGGNNDAFFAKLSNDGSTLLYATYLGGSGDEEGRGLALDAAGNIFLSGTTASPNFPLADALQQTNGGGRDVFAAKLNPAGNSLIYSTYLGGNGNDTHALGNALDSDGNLYVTGFTSSTNFPVVNALQPNNATNSDIFITKLSPISSVVPTLRVSITFDPPPPGQILPPQNVRVNAVQAMIMSRTGTDEQEANIVTVAGTIIDQIPQLTAFNVFRVPAPADGSIPTADQITGNPNNLVAMLPPNANSFTDFVPTNMNQNFFYSITSSFGNGMQSSGSPPVGTNLPVVRNPVLVKGALLIDSTASFILSGATLIVNDVQSYALTLDATAMKFAVTKQMLSTPGGLKIKKLVKKGATVKLVVRNPDGKSSLAVMYTRPRQ